MSTTLHLPHYNGKIAVHLDDEQPDLWLTIERAPFALSMFVSLDNARALRDALSAAILQAATHSEPAK